MESKEIDELIQRINSMQSEIDQQKSVIKDYDSKLAEIKGDLLSQEHRFLPAWMNLISHFKNKEKDHFKDKLSAVVQGFIPGAKSAVVIGGSIVGVFTLVLMYQSNQLMLLQNQYLQKQIYIQADSDRRNQLVNITEKLYEPSDAYAEKIRSQRDQGLEIPAEPKFNASTRAQSLTTYLYIKYNPLEEVSEQVLDSIPAASMTLWESLWGKRSVASSRPDKPIFDCNALGVTIRASVELNGALLSNIRFYNVCLKAASLVGADLSHSMLNGANLESSALIDAKLIGTELNQANIQRAAMEKADLTDARLHLANFTSTRMTGATLERAQLHNSILKSVILKDSNLRDAVFFYADLSKSDLTASNVSGANFIWANVRGTNFTKAIGLTCKQLILAKNWKLAITDLKCEEEDTND
jgi:hypothetical protein